MNTQHTLTSVIRKVWGILLFALSMSLVLALLFFYSSVLFSDHVPALNTWYDQFRLLFSIPTGIIVIWALFFSIFFPLIFIILFSLWLITGKRMVSIVKLSIMVGLWIVILLIGIAATMQRVELMLDRIMPFSGNPISFQISNEIPVTVRDVFRTTIKNEVQKKYGTPQDGYEPYMLISVFPGLTESDFEGVQSSIGSYTMQNGQLIHKTDNTKLIHPAAKAITDPGFDTLLANVSVRLGIDLTKDGTLTEIMHSLIQTDTTSSSTGS